MADRTRYLKESEEGVSEMCAIMEDLRQEAAKDWAIKDATNMLAEGLGTIEQIARITGLSISEVEALAVRRPA